MGTIVELNVSKYGKARNFICMLVMLSSLAWECSGRTVIHHYQDQERYAFGLKLLDLAMSKLNLDYEILGGGDERITEARGEAMVVSGMLDVEFLSTTPEREASMIPIKIPVYRGLLGLRLLLVKRSRKAELSHIGDLQGLAKLVGLHGSQWGDLPVYAANKLPVVTHVNYTSLFHMLIAGRADYFHRGISEITGELKRYEKELVIADNVALFYPHPVYFFVTKTRPELAQQIEKGLQIALKDGSYRALFDKEYREVIAQAGLQNRTIITLKNPVIPESTPPLDTSWWMPPGVEIHH